MSIQKTEFLKKEERQKPLFFLWWGQQDYLRTSCSMASAYASREPQFLVVVVYKKKRGKNLSSFCGGDNRTRTCDLMHVKHAL